MIEMNFLFLVTPAFQKSLKSLEKDIQNQIREKLQFLQDTSNPLSFAKKLRGYKDLFRFRIGDYRIIFQLKKDQIILLLVRHRKEIYEGI